jgi:transposase
VAYACDKQKSVDYKTTAVEYFLADDTTQGQVCRIFQCSRRSLMRWVKKYTTDGEITGYQRTPIATKVRKEHVEFLLHEIKTRKSITMEDLLVQLKAKYPDADITRQHLSRVVRDNNITLKLARVRHEPNKRFGKDIDINAQIKEFYNEVKKYKLEDMICIDETSVKSLQKRNHCSRRQLIPIFGRISISANSSNV